MKKILKIAAPVVLVSMVLAGCGGGASETKPIAEVKTEAQAMDANQLQAMVDRYKKAMEVLCQRQCVDIDDVLQKYAPPPCGEQ